MREFDYEKVKNPLFFEENRIMAHSDHVAYADMEEAQEENSSYRYSLDGIWKFAYAKNHTMIITGFEKPEYDTEGWDDIRVPAHIQMEGYDAPQYANVQYPWDGREDIWGGEIPTRFNPVASYVKCFTVPDTWKNQPVLVSFQGVESGMALWCNGTYVGYSEDSFTPSDFDLTPYLVEGENKLAVQVFKWTAGSWCEDQDFFRFSGIFRSVFLYTKPEVHVEDVKIDTDLDDEFQNADLNVELRVTGTGTVKYVLKKEDKVIATEERTIENGQQKLSIVVKNPELWSAESPALYDLVITLSNADGKVMEVVPQKVGFRRFEMKDSIMCLNGKRIVFKGANRHEFSSKTGRAVTDEEILTDILTMKRNNINAIRTSHYPNDSRIYKLCDQYGLYLIAENNMETHGAWDPYFRGIEELSTVIPGDNNDWKPLLLDRVNSCYQRDKNHPAILIWSCGNESFGGSVIFEMSEKFRELDPKRLVHYEGVFNDRRCNGSSDMESQMYPSVESIKNFLKEHRDKPFICCEYTHAMGNSCGAMNKYTDLTDTEPLYQGGFIWDYIDQSIQKKDRYGNEFQAYGGDFMERPTDYNFSGNGITYGGERDASPKMQSVKYNYQNIQVVFGEDKITVKNKNLFVNTSDFKCTLLLEKDGKLVKTEVLETSVNPLAEQEYQLPEAFCLEGKHAAGVYALTVSFALREDTLWAKAGHEVAFGQKVFEKKEENAACTEKIKVVRGKLNVGVRGREFEALFALGVHGLVSYRFAGKEMIEAIPKPNFWRAPTDNDNGNLMMQRYAQWKIASMYLTAADVDGVKAPETVVTATDTEAVITYTYNMPTRPVSQCTLSYHVFGDGTIETTLTYDPVKELGDMPEFGVMFKFNADYDRVEWFGMGPEETYADRMQGAKLGIYKNKVADNMAKYLVPQECGNKAGVYYAKVTDYKGRGMIFSGDKINFSALPYTPHEMENAMHPYELPQVHYTVVRVSAGQMGVAGDDSWGAKTHEEFLLDVSGKKEFTFRFKGI